MILNNYWNYRSYFDKTRFTGTEHTAAIPGFYAINGTNVQVLVGLNGGYVNWDRMVPLSENRCSRLRLGAYLSSSTEDPSADAYMVSNDITSSFTNIVTNTNIYTDGNGVITRISVSGDNISSSAVTIGSIGIYKLMHESESFEGTEYVYPFMFLIHKLEEPILVPSGEGFSESIDWIEQ